MSSRVTRSRARKDVEKMQPEAVATDHRGKQEDTDEVQETKKTTVSKKRCKKKKVEEETSDSVDNNLDDENDAIELKTKGSKRRRKKAGGETADEQLLRITVGARVRLAAAGKTKQLGMHATAAGGVARAIYDAQSIGCSAFALFVRNQRQWNSKPMEDTVVDEWHAAIKETSFDLSMIIPHGSYLLNPGSPDEEKLQKSRQTMLDECLRAERLGITLYNFHPGSSTGVGSREDCIRTVAASIDYVLQRTRSIALVVETMAGQGHTVGGTFEEIASILAQVEGNAERVGVCLDTCHIFAAGYDIRTRRKYEETMKAFDSVVGFDRLMAVHVNDSKSALGSHLDRHERIGKGEIGWEAFRCIMNDKRFNGIPLILETPEGDYANEMIELYALEEAEEDQ